MAAGRPVGPVPRPQSAAAHWWGRRRRSVTGRRPVRGDSRLDRQWHRVRVAGHRHGRRTRPVGHVGGRLRRRRSATGHTNPRTPPTGGDETTNRDRRDTRARTVRSAGPRHDRRRPGRTHRVAATGRARIRAVATTTAGLSTAHSSGSIELARCLVWAVATCSRPTSSKRPTVAVAANGR